MSGRTVGGLALYPEANRLSREQALRLYTVGSAWFSGEQEHKGCLTVGQFADFAVLSEDYVNVAQEHIRSLESVLTVVNGRPVYGAREFTDEAPPAPPVLPDWSPAAKFEGYGAPGLGHACGPSGHIHSSACGSSHQHAQGAHSPFWGSGCDCFAF